MLLIWTKIPFRRDTVNDPAHPTQNDHIDGRQQATFLSTHYNIEAQYEPPGYKGKHSTLHSTEKLSHF